MAEIDESIAIKKEGDKYCTNLRLQSNSEDYEETKAKENYRAPLRKLPVDHKAIFNPKAKLFQSSTFYPS